jgi:cobalt/nickel transport system ATP-binding protein
MGEILINSPVLELVNVSYKYPDGTLALNNVTLIIEKGKKIAVLGGNGAGKSTMFLVLNGVYKPVSGKILFKNNEVRYKQNELRELRKNVGIVFQDPDSQIFSASVYEEISFGPMNLELPADEIKKRVEEAMNHLNISKLKDKPTHLLSYGEKKRVSIADIMVMEPEVIIFDEPTSCLDPKQTIQIMDLFNDMNRKGKTVILSTHDVETAYSWADYIIVMKDGKVLQTGTPVEIFSDNDLLDKSSLEKPLILDIYEKLKDANFLLESENIPKNKDELFNLLKSNIQFKIEKAI